MLASAPSERCVRPVHAALHIPKPRAAARRVAPAPTRRPHRSSLTPRMPAPRTVAAAATPPSQGDDLLVIGPGVLGGLVAARWAAAHPAARVVGQTNSDAAHARLASLGVTPRVNADAEAVSGEAGKGPWPHVLFSAPPSGSPDYLASIAAALALWDASAAGAFVYTGSAAVFVEDGGGACGDASPLIARGASLRTDILLAAEDAVLGAGGCVLRLAGLYHAQRGAHTFFLRAGTVDRYGGYVVNLLHYEDAAALATAVLSGAGSPSSPLGWRSRAFIGADGAPVTFQAMCDAAVDSGAYPGAATVNFTAAAPVGRGLGKRLDASGTQAALGWAPAHASFVQFVKGGGQDAYTADERLRGGAAHQG